MSQSVRRLEKDAATWLEHVGTQFQKNLTAVTTFTVAACITVAATLTITAHITAAVHLRYRCVTTVAACYVSHKFTTSRMATNGTGRRTAKVK